MPACGKICDPESASDSGRIVVAEDVASRAWKVAPQGSAVVGDLAAVWRYLPFGLCGLLLRQCAARRYESRNADARKDPQKTRLGLGSP